MYLPIQLEGGFWRNILPMLSYNRTRHIRAVIWHISYDLIHRYGMHV